MVYTDFVVLFTQCSPYSLGGRFFLCSCELSRKDIVSKFISLKCPFEHNGCEKSWAEVQADSFSFECRGCTRMKELEVELEQLRLLVVAVVGREQVGGASGSGGGTVDDKVGEDDERDASESSPQPGGG